MAEDTIVIDIDDSALEEALAKIALVEITATQVVGTPSLYKSLPAINRELRIILSQVPGMREAITLWYRIRRLARGFDIGGMQLYLTVLATTVILIKQIIEYQKSVERRQREYEEMIRQYRGWTHEEYVKEMERWKLYSRRTPP